MIRVSECAESKFGLSLLHKNAMLRLPSGDHILVQEIISIRASDVKPDRRTGEIGAPVHVLAAGSWFTVRFGSQEEAREFADALAALRNTLLWPSAKAPMARGAADEIIGELKAEASRHAGPDDLDDERDAA